MHAEARGHGGKPPRRICGRPPACKRVSERESDRLRSYVRFRRPVRTLPSWFPRRAFQTRTRHQVPWRLSECRASGIDRSHHLFLLWQVPALARGDWPPHAKQQSQFLCSTESRFSVPTAFLKVRRAQPQSRSAERSGATAERGAASVLDGGEHGARLIRSGRSGLMLPP
jgi:hypothetical protein